MSKIGSPYAAIAEYGIPQIKIPYHTLLIRYLFSELDILRFRSRIPLRYIRATSFNIMCT